MKKSLDNTPNHVAIIMDGNGRWAKLKGKSRLFGHKNGIKSVQKIVEYATKIEIKNLTLYAFSTENWNRPKKEVKTLMNILINTLRKEINKMVENNVQFKCIGDISQLPYSVIKELEETIKKTSKNDGLVLTLALNYGFKKELIYAIKNLAVKVKKNLISIDNIDEKVINSHLYSGDLPSVDLLIRTSGEQRISNFLLWQVSYAELFFSEVFWPDFDENHFEKAIKNYIKRERRFGKTSEQVKN
jgi:undecaprenyl diphosphate synthase